MKKTLLIVPVILLIASFTAFGVDVQSYGYTVNGTHQENGKSFTDIIDSNGQAVSIATSGSAFTDANMKVLGDVLTTLESWSDLKIGSIKVIFNDDRADVLVVPTSFVYKDVDLAKYMPSGIQMYYDNYLQYDFRMLKDNLFLRLKGEVYDQDQFAGRAYEAVQNPVLFLQTNSPEYLLQRINDLVAKVDALSQKLDQSTTAMQSQLKQESDAQTELSSEVTSLRNAYLAMNNRAFLGLGKPTPIDQKAIDQIVALKTADPTLTRQQVADKLKAQGISLTSNEINLVFDVYFNDYQ
jgi:hypothetical protein